MFVFTNLLTSPILLKKFQEGSFPTCSQSYSEESRSEIWNEDKITYVQIEASGVKPEDVTITVQDSTMKVSWKKRIRGSEEKSSMQFKLSQDVDVDGASARVENGLITVELKKLPKPEARKIPVINTPKS